jgi:hypothetical protein
MASDREMDSKRKTLDRSCGITDASTKFALIPPGGRLVKLDDESNAKVAQDIRSDSGFAGASSGDFSSAASDNKKVYRLEVTGSMDGDNLHLNSIRQR